MLRKLTELCVYIGEQGVCKRAHKRWTTALEAELSSSAAVPLARGALPHTVASSGMRVAQTTLIANVASPSGFGNFSTSALEKLRLQASLDAFADGATHDAENAATLLASPAAIARSTGPGDGTLSSAPAASIRATKQPTSASRARGARRPKGQATADGKYAKICRRCKTARFLKTDKAYNWCRSCKKQHQSWYPDPFLPLAVAPNTDKKCMRCQEVVAFKGLHNWCKNCSPTHTKKGNMQWKKLNTPRGTNGHQQQQSNGTASAQSQGNVMLPVTNATFVPAALAAANVMPSALMIRKTTAGAASTPVLPGRGLATPIGVFTTTAAVPSRNNPTLALPSEGTMVARAPKGVRSEGTMARAPKGEDVTVRSEGTLTRSSATVTSSHSVPTQQATNVINPQTHMVPALRPMSTSPTTTPPAGQYYKC